MITSNVLKGHGVLMTCAWGLGNRICGNRVGNMSKTQVGKVSVTLTSLPSIILKAMSCRPRFCQGKLAALREEPPREMPSTMDTDKATSTNPSLMALENEWLPPACVLLVAWLAGTWSLTETDRCPTS